MAVLSAAPVPLPPLVSFVIIVLSCSTVVGGHHFCCCPCAVGKCLDLEPKPEGVLLKSPVLYCYCMFIYIIIIIIIIIMYIYPALINALSAHVIHINLNLIFYTHVEHSPTKTIYLKYYIKTKTKQKTHYKHIHARTHTRTHTHTHAVTVAETGY